MNNPITPPPELVEQRWNETQTGGDFVQEFAAFFARWGADQQLKLDAEQITQAYQAGADQELEACCVEVAWLESSEVAKRLRERRRPKPPSLKQQALAKLAELEGKLGNDFPKTIASLRRTIEALPND